MFCFYKKTSVLILFLYDYEPFGFHEERFNSLALGMWKSFQKLKFRIKNTKNIFGTQCEIAPMLANVISSPFY